ncbi:MAG: hypothetical protein WBG90_00800 [Saonia sp.]
MLFIRNDSLVVDAVKVLLVDLSRFVIQSLSAALKTGSAKRSEESIGSKWCRFLIAFGMTTWGFVPLYHTFRVIHHTKNIDKKSTHRDSEQLV